MQNSTDVLRGRALELYDSKDRLRIFMHAGDEDDPDTAVVTIYSAVNDHRIELISDNNGFLNIHIRDNRFDARVSMTLNPEKRGGFLVNDSAGRQGVVLGSRYDSEVHQLLLFSDGDLVWSSPIKKAEQDATANP